jgi:multiple sugar transport system substrate-binding protein
MKRTAIILLGLLLAAAGVFASGQTGDSASTSKPVTIEVQNLDAGQPNKDAFAEIVGLFEEKNPNIKVEVIFAGWDEGQDKLLVRSSAGDPPDIGQFNDDYIGDHADRGLLLPLDDLFADVDLSKYFQGAIDISRVNGKLMAFQIAQKPRGFFYANMDWFKEAGMDLPTSTWGDPNWNWDSLIELAKKLQGTRKDSYGFAHHLTDEPKRWMLSNTTAPNNLVMNGELMFDAPWVIETMQYFADIINVHKIHPSWATMNDIGKAQLFLDGKAAMIQSGSWEIPAFRDATFQWDLLPIPTKVRAVTEASMVNYSIMAGTDNPEEAALFAKFTLEEEPQKIWGKHTGHTPSLIEAAKDISIWAGDVPAKNEHILVDALTYTYYGPFNEPGWYQARTVLKPYLADIYNGAKPAAELMMLADKKGQEAIDKR